MAIRVVHASLYPTCPSDKAHVHPIRVNAC
jgi:hypothetical protein